jgi:hypothetical protein
MHLFLNNSGTDSVFSLSAAKKSPKAHLNGLIRALLVAKKGTQIVHVFRRKGIEFHKEVLYKKYVKAAHPVVKMVSASREKDGFNGYISLCEGHPRFSEAASTEDSTLMPYKYSWNQNFPSISIKQYNLIGQQKICTESFSLVQKLLH